jgi:hypothetical protein
MNDYMQTVTNKEQKRLVQKFHILLSRYGIDNDTKLAILQQYNVTSSVYLTCAQLLEVCALLERMHNPEAAEMDKLRKRLMGAIGGWLRAMNREESAKLIAAIACRASGRNSFNDIPKEQLRSLYSAFRKKINDMQMVEQLTADELTLLGMSN